MRKIKNEELNRLSPEEFKSSEKNRVIIVLDDVRSAMNVGSAFRTSDAFLVEKICLCGITAQPPHREINKTALGAQDTVAWEHFPTITHCIQTLREEGYQIIAIEQADESTSLLKFEATADHKYAFVFGNEVFGINETMVENADLVVEIPQYGSKHSLNISVSMGIVLWDYLSKTNLC